MNVFRLAGDISHLLAIIILLLKIWTSRSCAGISGKSQVMFAITYTARYLDLFTNFISLYNSTMKIIFLGAAYATLYLIYVRFKATYDHNHDTFRVEFLLIPTVILSVLINHDFSPLEILWTFSIYLESVAILPQLFMVSKTGEAESITSHYLFALGSYRALYIINWVYRYYAEGFYDLIAIVAGVVQTVLYCDFFYLYITKGSRANATEMSIEATRSIAYAPIFTFIRVFGINMSLLYFKMSAPSRKGVSSRKGMILKSLSLQEKVKRTKSRLYATEDMPSFSKERSFNYQPKTEVFFSVAASPRPAVGATNTPPHHSLFHMAYSSVC
ncbi:ER lumen protein-retaining receptor 1 [Chionoecetes opilio]|uniref:ER lumen protein-retaining receptor n=1 Tax=Chionoecetes opilio TaxID=41210 RepID=A0A8J5CNT9_CHIOP|nr:ER lumen protein-retaining receptor 1 [Chionoecetes opilio]